MSRLNENSREAKTEHFTGTRDAAQVAAGDLAVRQSTKVICLFGSR
jgi:hypothetical protein